jgi:hypothetical protein
MHAAAEDQKIATVTITGNIRSFSTIAILKCLEITDVNPQRCTTYELKQHAISPAIDTQNAIGVEWMAK